MPSTGFLDFNFLESQKFFEFLLRFAFNTGVIYVIARLIYFRLRKNRDYLFTLFVFNLVVFFVCYMLDSAEVSIGVAFGIFAIFSILRYRTTTIPIKEMTYMFIAISVAIINGLSNGEIKFIMQIFINITMIVITVMLEKAWVKNELRQNIIYEKIDLIKPENHGKLLLDLKMRTGLDIHRFEIGQIDFLRDVAKIRVYYYDTEHKGFSEETNDYDYF